MAGFREYLEQDGLGLAGLIRRKEISPREVLEAAIERIEALNPRLNAVVHKMYEEAEKALENLPQGPFAGVPFLLKDLEEAYRGHPLTAGSRAYRDYIPDYDSETVRRYKAAGFLILGKTNTPELGLLAYTEPRLFGPTRNPWDPSRTTGGSSGGSAAAVAAGMVPMASAGDGGGSIRIPASHCALFGLKPSRGRTPTGPKRGLLWHGAAVLHALTRSVRDSAAVLDLLTPPEPGSPFLIPPPERPFLEEVGRDPGSLRIALDTRSPLGTPVDPECIRAAEEAARLLEALGHTVEEARPPIDGLALAKSYLTLYLAWVAAEARRIRAQFGPGRLRDLEPQTLTLARLGEAVPAAELSLALEEWDRAARALGRFFQGYDLYLTPTVARPPIRIGALNPPPLLERLLDLLNRFPSGGLYRRSGLIERIALENLAATPFTQLANLTGVPAVSLPLHWTKEDLPLGVQLLAPFGEEARLIRVSAQLEAARPWSNRRPPLASATA